MARVKTSVYVDGELWERFRRYALRRGLGVGRALEELLREELFLEDLGDALLGLAGGEDYELDFEPVRAREPVSGLVRDLRDERADSLSGQQRDR